MNSSAPENDQNLRWGALMEQVQQGDQAAAQQLYSEIAPVILAFCTRRAGYLGIPDEVSQNALITIHKNRHVYIPGRSFRAWMFAIVRHKLIDQIRRQGKFSKEQSFQDDNDVTTEPRDAYTNIQGVTAEGSSPAELGTPELVDDQVLALRTAISELPPKYRDAIVMIKLEGFSVSEAAAKAGVSESALKVRCHRAFKMLSERLKDDE